MVMVLQLPPRAQELYGDALRVIARLRRCGQCEAEALRFGCLVLQLVQPRLLLRLSILASLLVIVKVATQLVVPTELSDNPVRL